MSSTDLGNKAWRKSTRSGNQTNCVELASTAQQAAIRDSKNPAGPVLTFSRAQLGTFLAEVRSGRFDL